MLVESGRPLQIGVSMQTTTHSKMIGYIIWIFGFTGAHRFYYGKPISGTVYFLTLGLLGIGWFIDLFLIPSLDRQADRRYTAGQYDYNLSWIFLTFLGVFGVHRFYLGKLWTGLLYLVSGGLVGIGVLWDMWHLNEMISKANEGAN